MKNSEQSLLETKLIFKKHQPTLSLKPTQFSIGLLEVEFKVAEMKKLKPKKLRKLVKSTPIPVIISPFKELCVIDHHHFLFACWHAGVDEVRIEIVKDYSRMKMPYITFWRQMARWKKAYLRDQFGDGPRNPLYLPIDVRGMADDPYRSLAWMVRKEGGFENSSQTFAEFQWADYFRGKKLLDRRGRAGFHDAVKRGLELAKAKKSSHLPGFRGPSKLIKEKEKAAIKKSKYVPQAQKKGHLATVPRLKTS